MNTRNLRSRRTVRPSAVHIDLALVSSEVEAARSAAREAIVADQALAVRIHHAARAVGARFTVQASAVQVGLSAVSHRVVAARRLTDEGRAGADLADTVVSCQAALARAAIGRASRAATVDPRLAPALNAIETGRIFAGSGRGTRDPAAPSHSRILRRSYRRTHTWSKRGFRSSARRSLPHSLRR